MNPQLLMSTLIKVLGVKIDPVEVAQAFDYAKSAVPALAQKVEEMEASLARIEANQKKILEWLQSRLGK